MDGGIGTSSMGYYMVKLEVFTFVRLFARGKYQSVKEIRVGWDRVIVEMLEVGGGKCSRVEEEVVEVVLAIWKQNWTPGLGQRGWCDIIL
ncbi:hypothetical protein HOY82DRAFT_586634 [Tuber indicum]|nr:hypothetical protein HOY82DRAFT_586634 [Tuber indicum]